MLTAAQRSFLTRVLVQDEIIPRPITVVEEEPDRVVRTSIALIT
jgi:hypothetical protein